MIAFELLEREGGSGLTWVEANAHCTELGKALCLESQWLRACAQDEAIGRVESWTLTADYPGAAVRGGAEGCAQRSFSKLGAAQPERVGLCCDRVVAVTSLDAPEELRAAASEQILSVERALAHPTAEEWSEVVAESISLDGVYHSRDAALAEAQDARKKDQDLLSFYDHCKIDLVSEGFAPRMILDCGVIRYERGHARGFSQRIAFNSATGPVHFVGSAANMTPKERKERIKAFLTGPSDRP